MKKTKNILLITSDQQRWDTIGAMNPTIKTPNLDKLAEKGIVFTQAYTVNPVCTPTRCTMLTGQYPSRHGCFHVGTSLPADYLPTLADSLNQAGYFTGLLGKAHFQACYQDENSFESAPNIHRLDFFENWSGPYYGFKYAQLNIGHTSEPHACGMNYGVWLTKQGVDLSKYFGIHDYQHFGNWELPEDLHCAKWTADKTMKAIAMAQKNQQPFFLWTSFQDPHNPYVCPEPWSSMYDPDEITLPHLGPDDMSAKPPFYQSIVEGNAYGTDPDLQYRSWGDCKTLPHLKIADIKKIYAAYYGMISLMDFHIGRIITYLEEQDLWDDTIIVFTSDHGDHLGGQGLWGKGLPAYDDVQKVPFIVYHPDCKTPGEKSRAIQSPVDFMSTFVHIANGEVPPATQGLNQHASWLDAAHKSREWAMLECRPAQDKFIQRTFIYKNYKLVLYKDRDYGELYDLIHDPNQNNNLFDLEEFSELRRTLVAKFDYTEFEQNELIRERTAYA